MGDASPPLTVTVCWGHDHEAILTLCGELDLVTAPDALRFLTEALDKDPKRLIFDLARLSFMDSQGVKLVVRARQGLPSGRPVIIRSPGPSVLRVLQLTGLHHVCTIENSSDT